MEELSHTAFHEAGHAVAAVTAFKDARWLPNPPPSPVVLSVEITDNGGQFLGNCTAMGIFSTKWPARCVSPRYRLDLIGIEVPTLDQCPRQTLDARPIAQQHCQRSINTPT
jgi:hypothetical protein